MFLRNFKILGSGAFKGVKGWGLEGEGHEGESQLPSPFPSIILSLKIVIFCIYTLLKNNFKKILCNYLTFDIVKQLNTVLTQNG